MTLCYLLGAMDNRERQTTRMAIATRAFTLRAGVLVVVATMVLMGSKCITYDETLGEPLPSNTQVSTANGGVTPAVPCSKPGVARIRVVDTSYQNDCGCVEKSGKVCTIARGTRVQWVFGDSEEHNVTSKASIFSDSDDLLGGTHEHLFDDPGTFGYSCSLHASMRGYSIVVVDPNESSD